MRHQSVSLGKLQGPLAGQLIETLDQFLQPSV
jgi:hypothetical protein